MGSIQILFEKLIQETELNSEHLLELATLKNMQYGE